MSTMLDTSVLVAAFVRRHPRHDVAIGALRRADDLTIAAHMLAETYAVLTRLPTRPRISGGVARKLIRENLTARGRVVALSARDYDAALGRMADLGLTGGAVYDALIVAAAQKAKVDRFVTFNGADFRRVWPEAGDRLAVLG